MVSYSVRPGKKLLLLLVQLPYFTDIEMVLGREVLNRVTQLVGSRHRNASSSPKSGSAPFIELVLLKVCFCEVLNADYQ